MSTRTRAEFLHRCAAVVRAGAIAALLALPGQLASAQDAAPAAPAPAPAPEQAQPPMSKPGAIEAIGRWFSQGAANVRDHMRGAKERIDSLGDKAAADRKKFDDAAADAGKNAATATKNAVDAVAKLPAARVMTGRERCAVAPNGAPDCLAAAEALCRKHGFASGKSMDFTSAEECPTRVLLSGRQPGVECPTVTFISRAMCQ